MSIKNTTSCVIKNVSKYRLSYLTSKDWQGQIGASGLERYPEKIAPKAPTPARFEHIGNDNGSQGAVVYRINDTDTFLFDVLIAWFSQPNSADKKILTLIEEPGAFCTDRWPSIFDTLIHATNKSSAVEGEFKSEVEICGENFATIKATISPASAPAPAPTPTPNGA